MTELKDIRKQEELTMPSGAKVTIWLDDNYVITSQMEEYFMKNAKFDKDGKPTEVNFADPQAKKIFDDQLINRIVKWDYTEDEQELAINMDNIKKLPAKDVNQIKQKIAETQKTIISKNG